MQERGLASIPAGTRTANVASPGQPGAVANPWRWQEAVESAAGAGDAFIVAVEAMEITHISFTDSGLNTLIDSAGIYVIPATTYNNVAPATGLYLVSMRSTGDGAAGIIPSTYSLQWSGRIILYPGDTLYADGTNALGAAGSLCIRYRVPFRDD